MSRKTETAFTYVARGDNDERARILACNRVLLYARGLDLGAEDGLELAQESLRRAGNGADLEAVLGQMHLVLHERGIDPILSDDNGRRLASAPPLRRASMVSDSTLRRSFLGWIASGLRGAFSLLIPGKSAWNQRQI